MNSVFNHVRYCPWQGRSVLISKELQLKISRSDIVNRAVRKFRRVLFPLDSFLKKVSGVIHVGANTGQEREQYASLGLNVLWVEPIPTVFEVLRSNIASFSNQRACCYLLAAEHGTEYTFHIANNGGASSSILDFSKHRDIWPDVHFTHDIRIEATTLARMIDIEKINLGNFGALILDTQGSELLVLKGAIPVLEQFQFVETEAANFESYAGCCQLDELTNFMRRYGFKLVRKSPFAGRLGVGTYYDVLYSRS
jgi:FkbM family methyltransferase